MLAKMRKIWRDFRKSQFSYTPLSRIELNARALEHNYKTFKNRYPDLSIAPVLKSNAYGHGLIEVASILDSLNPPFFIVDSYFEALILRNENIKTNILILGFVYPKDILNSKLKNLSYTISNLEILEIICREARSILRIQLKVDTGMHRQGILKEEVDQALEMIKANKNIILEGVLSHFADSENTESVLNIIQTKEWNKIIHNINGKFPNIPYYHIANTSGSYSSSRAGGNILRLGIGLYGIDPIDNRESEGDKIILKPALELKTIVTSIKNIKTGDKVGYNAIFIARNDMKIATIPLGYYEGIDRNLSNKGYVYIGDKKCQIIGRVSMNITVIDVTELENLEIGDEVVVISSDNSKENSVSNIAKTSLKIPYEILVNIGKDIRRIIN